MATKKPIGIVVRRGALRRFDALMRKTAELPVEITWDRRLEERRASDEAAGNERRSGDRRRRAPFTWEAADFVVIDETPQPQPDAAEVPRRKTRTGR